ncbi:MAG: porin [Moraxella sp.]|uniref:porin n=1 Tax=Moraxella sp. TaxID=479 RepID=UPI0026DD705E|nr:porin [Moraxella sp.]MDO4450251.1 porin [Moraxella sp.]
MKKLLLASAVAALSISAQAAPQVYGKAFLTLDLQDGNNVAKEAGLDTRTQLNSNASRIGFKGAEALTANTNLIYQLEYRVEVDDNTRTFEARDSYLGLSNEQYGTLLAGRLTAIDGMVDYANVTEGGVVGGDNVLASFDAPRANNAFAYVSPSYNGLNFLGMYVLDENNSTDSLGRDAWGVGAQYEPNGAAYRAGATYIQAGNFKATRVSGAYDLTDATTIGALYQNTQFGGDLKKENAFTVSATQKLAQTPWTAYGQLDFVDNAAGIKDDEVFRVAAGGKYAFNKATTGHIYGAYLTNKGEGVETAKAYGIGTGIEYKF